MKKILINEDQAQNTVDSEQDSGPAANNTGTPINTLPKDMVLYISTFLTEPQDNQAYAVALGTHSPTFFNRVSPISTEILLTHVMRGDLDVVEKMLKADKANKVNKYLLNKKGTITDLSGRTFKNITAFQYAVWALDTPMWELILPYLSEKEAAIQLKDFENRKDIIDTHGAHFSFDPILNNLKNYNDSYNGWNWTQREDYWCKNVGGAQRAFPAWLIMTMCEEGEEVAWVKNDPTLTVKRDMKHLTWWMEQEYSGGVLGCKWAAVRGGALRCSSLRRTGGSAWMALGFDSSKCLQEFRQHNHKRLQSLKSNCIRTMTY